jgi:hypothetical protein
MMDRKARVVQRIEMLVTQLSPLLSDPLRATIAEEVADSICNDLLIIGYKDGDESIDCRVGDYGRVFDSNGKEIHYVEHGNLTTGELVTINCSRLDEEGEVARVIEKFPAPMRFERGQ